MYINRTNYCGNFNIKDEGKQITVSIGVSALGCPDDTIYRLHHKHGDSAEAAP